MKTLNIENLDVARAQQPALFQASASLRGGVHLLMAPNGLGKSTLLQILSGILPAPRGELFLEDGTEKRLLKNEMDVFYLPEYLQLPQYIYPREWVSHLNGPFAEEDYSQAMARFRLEGFEKRFLGRMSQGERRKVTWVAAAVSSRSILLLDEPLDGLDLHGIEAARLYLAEWRKQGKIVIVVTHQAGEVLDVVDDLLLIDQKKLKVLAWKAGTSLGELRNLLRTTYT